MLRIHLPVGDAISAACHGEMGETATVFYSDEYAKDPTFISKEDLVEQSEIVIVGVPHRAYRDLSVPDRVHLVDLWGVVPQRRLD